MKIFLIILSAFLPWNPSLSDADFYINGQIIGSGSLIVEQGQQYILSVNHVSSQADKVCLQNRCFEPEFVADVELDISVMPVKGFRHARKLDVQVKQGEEVTVFGNTHGIDNVQTHGHVALTEVPYGEHFFMIDCFAFFGNSGSPAYNSDGDVLGVVDALPGDGRGGYLDLPLCVKSSRIRDFIKSV